LHPNQIYKFTLHLENKALENLPIVGITTGCGCAVAKADFDEIKKNKTGKVVVGLRPSGSAGGWGQRIVVHASRDSQGPKPLEVFVKGRLLPLVGPEFEQKYVTKADSAHSVKFRIVSNNDEINLDRASVLSRTEGVKITSVDVIDNKHLDITVDATGGFSSGRRSGKTVRVHLTVNVPKSADAESQVVIYDTSINITYRDAWEIRPSIVTFSPLEAEESSSERLWEGQVMIVNASGFEFEQLECDDFQVSASDLAESFSFKVVSLRRLTVGYLLQVQISGDEELDRSFSIKVQSKGLGGDLSTQCAVFGHD
jgi:hypothetical protein